LWMVYILQNAPGVHGFIVEKFDIEF